MPDPLKSNALTGPVSVGSVVALDVEDPGVEEGVPDWKLEKDVERG